MNGTVGELAPPLPADARLAGKVAVVSGAGSRTAGLGNGRAAAIVLARHGARVALLDKDLDAAEFTARAIRDAGGEALALQADVSREADCRDAIAAAAGRWGRLDVLVNNVGITGPAGTAEEVDLAAWDAALRVNVTAMMLTARHAVAAMARGGGGSVVNISSVAGLRGGHPSLLYPTAKGAVISMTRAMAAHHGRQGVRVNCIAPGTVYTPMVASRGMTPAMRDARRNATLLGTEGTGWDVGYAVLFLAGDESRWVTGVVLPVDGGATAGSAAALTPRSDAGPA